MQLITPELREQLIANGKNRETDHFPVVKCFHPVGAATWLIYAMDPKDNDYLHCLADLGMGCPELGGVLLSELEDFRGPLGLGIERDLYFNPKYPIRIYAAAARNARRIVESGQLLEDAARDAGLPVPAKAGATDSVGHRNPAHESAVRETAAAGTSAHPVIGTGARYPYDLPADHDRHREAVLIVDPGACNPSGVALSLYNACRQVIAEGGNQRTDPAVRLIVTQISYLTNSHADLDHDEYRALIEACKAKAGGSAT